MNSINVIHPYWCNGTLVYDDESLGIIREPFTSGMDVLLSSLASQVDGCATGFAVLFSDRPFPGYQHVLKWTSEHAGGNWYCVEADGRPLAGWLGGSLLKRFSTSPDMIFVEIRNRRSTWSEIWGAPKVGNDDYA